MLTGKGSGNATYDRYTSAATERYDALQSLLGMATTSTDMGGGQHVVGGDLTPSEWSFLATQGITPQNLQQQYNNALSAMQSSINSGRVSVGGSGGM
jgi:hypothetical protein